MVFHRHTRTFFGHTCLDLYVKDLSTKLVGFVEEEVLKFLFDVIRRKKTVFAEQAIFLRAEPVSSFLQTIYV